MKKISIITLLFAAVSAFGQGSAAPSISVVSNPAAGSQATASIVGQDAIRHVADYVCFSAAATTAPSLTLLTVNLRDGATGAGTVLATFTVAIPATTGQSVLPACTYVGVGGTAATAMTLEYSASLANLSESVTLIYHNTPK